MKAIKGIPKTKEIHVVAESLALDVYYGLASSIEDAKEKEIKRCKYFYGKDIKVFFDGVA